MRVLYIPLLVLLTAMPVAAAEIVEIVPLEFYGDIGDGGCFYFPSGYVCAIDIVPEWGLSVDAFDESLGELDHVVIDVTVAMAVTSHYRIIESIEEHAPTLAGIPGNECLGLTPGDTCTVDYGTFEYTTTDIFSPERLGGGLGLYYLDPELRHVWGYQADWHDDDITPLPSSQAVVTYVYTPLPEPSTGLAIALGLVFAGGWPTLVPRSPRRR
jgi:hypothetical protein